MEFVDLNLARRLEMAEATACRNCAEAFHRQHPDFPVAVEEIAGGYAVFAGVDSPVTQAIGVGLHGEVADSELDHLRGFFHSRGAAAAVELCPLVEMSLYERFAKRGFHLLEVSDVLFRKLATQDGKTDAERANITVRSALPDEAKLWTKDCSARIRRTFPGYTAHARRDGRFLHRRLLFHCADEWNRGRWRRSFGKWRSVRPFRREHAAQISPARRSGCVAICSSRMGCRAGMRRRGKYRATGKRFAPQS